MKLLRSIVILGFVLASFKAKADSWIDPSWREMLDTSNLVALVEYVNSGDFQAEAKIISVYKGNLKPGDLIWISNFSNRYGPIDKMEKGDKYVVFLNLIDQNEDRTFAYDEQLAQNLIPKGFVDAYKNNRAFWTPSPTSGDLKVKGKNVRYDLTSTTFHANQKFYSLRQFEQFLNAYFQKKPNAKLVSALRDGLISDSDPDQVSQHLMQLYFLGYDKYEEVYDEFADYAPENTKFALAQLLGNVKNDQSRNVLTKLLKDDSSRVQGEAVRQLKKEPVEIVGPLFVENLKKASPRNFGPGNLMNPVMNRIDGGKTEIIRALGEMKYKPAIPDFLLSLLNTDDPDQFELVIDALRAIGSRDYVNALNSNLLNKNDKLAYKIAEVIVSENLRECLPSLKYYLSNCDRNKANRYLISKIAEFGDKETVSFLLFDYQRFLSDSQKLESDKQLDWNNAYIGAFTTLKAKEARNLIYNSIFDWTGFNLDFAKNPKLFEIKKASENEMKQKFGAFPEFKTYKLSHDIAFIKNTSDVSKGENPMVEHLIEVVIPSEDEPKVAREKLLSKLNIDPKNLYIKFDSGIYWQQIQTRFDKGKDPTDAFAKYAEALPNLEDAAFFQALIDNNALRNSYQEYIFSEAIRKIRSSVP